MITTVSTFVSSGLGAAYYMILARALGTTEYGLFSLGITVLMMMVGIADLGSNQAMVRFVGVNRDGNYYPFAKLSLLIKVVTGLTVIIGFWLFSGPLATFVLRQTDAAGILPWVGLGVMGQLLAAFSVSLAQSLQKFWIWGALQVGGNILRLILLVIAMLVFFEDSTTGIVVFALACVSMFIGSWKWLDRRTIFSKITTAQIQEFWKFSRWTLLMSVGTVIVSRLDTLFTARYLDLSQVGIYSLSTTMAYFMPQLSTALGAVTTAKFAGIKEASQERTYLIKSVIFITAIVVGVGLLMIPVALLVIRFTGSSYLPSFAPFVILLGGLVTFVATNPVRDSIMYYHARPKFAVFLAVVQAVVLVILCPILIPRYQVMGAAVSSSISLFVVSIVSVLYYLLRLNNEKK
jgi:stage V sporulation protein B